MMQTGADMKGEIQGDIARRAGGEMAVECWAGCTLLTRQPVRFTHERVWCPPRTEAALSRRTGSGSGWFAVLRAELSRFQQSTLAN